MSLAASIALAGLIAGGDTLSTRDAYARLRAEGVRPVDQSVAGPTAGPILFGACVGAGDYLIQKEAPKLRWYYRGVVIVGGALVVRHNMQVGRRSRR